MVESPQEHGHGAPGVSNLRNALGRQADSPSLSVAEVRSYPQCTVRKGGGYIVIGRENKCKHGEKCEKTHFPFTCVQIVNLFTGVWSLKIVNWPGRSKICEFPLPSSHSPYYAVGIFCKTPLCWVSCLRLWASRESIQLSHTVSKGQSWKQLCVSSYQNLLTNYL